MRRYMLANEVRRRQHFIVEEDDQLTGSSSDARIQRRRLSGSSRILHQRITETALDSSPGPVSAAIGYHNQLHELGWITLILQRVESCNYALSTVVSRDYYRDGGQAGERISVNLREMLDFHNHLMPGVDDGAADAAESRFGLQTLVAQGITGIITTPHLIASLTERSPRLQAQLRVHDAAWDTLSGLASEEFPTLRLERGVELMLDVPKPDLSDDRLRLAGTSFVLVEFPFMMIPPNSTAALREIRTAGWTPIVAHPERYGNMRAHVGLLDEWRDAGAFMQGNCGSLVGSYGSTPKQLGWEFLGRGLIDYLCSDYHARGKCAVSACAEALEAAGGHEQLRSLMQTNHERLLADEFPAPVSPLEPAVTPLWKKLLRR